MLVLKYLTIFYGEINHWMFNELKQTEYIHSLSQAQQLLISSNLFKIILTEHISHKIKVFYSATTN